MGFRDRIRKKQRALKKKMANPKVRRQGRRFPSIFIKDKIPEGVEFWQCKEGEHLIDIIPFEVGKNMPLDISGRPIAEEGELWHVLDIWVHYNINGNPYVCPYENFGEPCPICEYIQANRLPKDIWSKLRPKHRNIYLIWCHDNRKEEKKGIQIFDVSDFFMGEKLEEIATLPRGGGYIEYFDIDDGKTIVFTRKGTGMENTKYLGHKFIDRDEPIPDWVLEQTFPLDEVVQMHPSYEEIEKSFNKMMKNIGSPTDEEMEVDDEIEDDIPDLDEEPAPWEEESPKRNERRKPRKVRKNKFRRRS